MSLIFNLYLKDWNLLMTELVFPYFQEEVATHCDRRAAGPGNNVANQQEDESRRLFIDSDTCKEMQGLL